MDLENYWMWKKREYRLMIRNALEQVLPSTEIYKRIYINIKIKHDIF